MFYRVAKLVWVTAAQVSSSISIDYGDLASGRGREGGRQSDDQLDGDEGGDEPPPPAGILLQQDVEGPGQDARRLPLQEVHPGGRWHRIETDS